MEYKPKKERKVVITEKHYFDIHLEGDSCYSTAKTLREAEKIAKEMEEKEKSEVAKYNDQERFNMLVNKQVMYNIQYLIEDLVNDAREATRCNQKEKSETIKELRKRLKDEIERAKTYVQVNQIE